jgi:hypothetical protein
MSRRIGTIEKWNDVNEVRVYAGSTPAGLAGTITLIDGEIEFNFPQTVVMTKQQAAFIAAHIITLITG